MVVFKFAEEGGASRRVIKHLPQARLLLPGQVRCVKWGEVLPPLL